jgi:hypothetical protein
MESVHQPKAVESSAKHTPGPWHFNQGWGAVCSSASSEPEQLITPVWRHGTDKNGMPFPEQAEADANARLIAAAPDLLAALRLAESSLSTYRATGAFTAGQPSGWLLAQLSDAIAKAEGGGE